MVGTGSGRLVGEPSPRVAAVDGSRVDRAPPYGGGDQWTSVLVPHHWGLLLSRAFVRHTQRASGGDLRVCDDERHAGLPAAWGHRWLRTRPASTSGLSPTTR